MTRKHSLSLAAQSGVAIYLVGVNALALVAMLLVWPADGEGEPSFLATSADLQYLLISILGGALGTSVVLLMSFATYAGHQALVASWNWWYLLRPFTGATLGLVVYAAVRGGILKVSSEVDALNPFSVAALSAMVGLFSRNILDRLNNLLAHDDRKLSEAFDSVFGHEVPSDQIDKPED